MARYRKYLLPGVLILAAVLLPFVDALLGLNVLFTAITVAIFVMLALGLNIVVGFAGLLEPRAFESCEARSRRAQQ